MRACTSGLTGSLALIGSVFPAFFGAAYVAARKPRDNSFGRSRLDRDRPDIGRSRADHAAGLSLLHGMRQPGGAARHGKNRRERLARQADGVEQKAGVHLDISLDTAAGVGGLAGRDRGALDVDDEAEPRRVRLEALEGCAQKVGARIAMAEDAMTEAHQAFAESELARDPAVDIAARLDLVEHIERQPRRAAM